MSQNPRSQSFRVFRIYTENTVDVGVEIEGFVYDRAGKLVNLPLLLKELGLPGASIMTDAGTNHLELVSRPHRGLCSAWDEVEHHRSSLPGDWLLYFTAHRPYDDGPPEKLWVAKPRTTALHKALKEVCPEGWQGVLRMVNCSAVHLNVGIDPWSCEGMLIMNLINNVGPYIGARLREELPESKGHMAYWQGFAEPGRLPRHGEWYYRPSELARAVSQLKRLVDGEEKNGGKWWVDCENRSSIFNEADRGVWWKLARPKKSSHGWYIEIRVLPSMPIPQARIWSQQLLNGILAIANWSVARGHSVCPTSEEAVGALRVAHRVTHGLFPDHILGPDEWVRCFNA
jgi:hypothetical protein